MDAKRGIGPVAGKTGRQDERKEGANEMVQGDKVYRNGVEFGTVNWVSGGVVSVRASAALAYLWFDGMFARRADGGWDWLEV